MRFQVGDLVVIHYIDNKYLKHFINKIVEIVDIVGTERPYIVHHGGVRLKMKESELRELTKLERSLK